MSDGVLGVLIVDAEGGGRTRITHRFDADVETVWSALTDPARLALWLGELVGDLRLGGQYRALYYASGWEGTLTVVECEPPVSGSAAPTGRLALCDADANRTVATLGADSEGSVLVVEQDGIPADLLWAYGIGNQIHVEDLAAHLTGAGRVDAAARFAELEPSYRTLAPVRE